MPVLIKSLIIFLLVLFSCVFLCTGCSDKEDNNHISPNNSQQVVADGQEQVIPNLDLDNDDDINQDNVDFTLTPEDNPEFNSAQNEEVMYTIEDGYAYALDPVTLEKTGPALDPITKEVVDIPNSKVEIDENDMHTQDSMNKQQEGLNTSFDESEQQNDLEPNEGSGMVSTNVDTTLEDFNSDDTYDNLEDNNQETSITEQQIAMPNTGIFLEDD